MVPSPGDVRTEEFVNAFDQDYAPPAQGIDVRMDGTAVPWLPERSRVVRVGVQSSVVDQRARPDANLTFVIDVSGSMADDNKLPAVKEALHTLTKALRPTDTVTIVVYSDKTRTVLKRTPAAQASAITGAIDDLVTEGSTNAEAGLKRGYEEAQKSYQQGKLNRVVLLSDGVANVGNTGPEAMLRTIGDAARRQIDLVTVGFGDPFNDPLMEQLANRGNGFYAYCDSAAEATRLFRENLTGTLVVTGRDAKAQVEFDPAQVASYRLLGYENRDVADGDFRNDKVDGGEVGSGHAVTALYEIDLAPDADAALPLGRATVRYLHPETREPVERTASVRPGDLAASPDRAPVRLHQDIAVATFSESLRGGPWARLRTPHQVAEDAKAVAVRTPDPRVAELVELTGRVADR
ncbi:VWA domain-containing protein [Mariniluteicoccus flavus]